jgi:hypothetical protein
LEIASVGYRSTIGSGFLGHDFLTAGLRIEKAIVYGQFSSVKSSDVCVELGEGLISISNVSLAAYGPCLKIPLVGEGGSFGICGVGTI